MNLPFVYRKGKSTPDKYWRKRGGGYEAEKKRRLIRQGESPTRRGKKKKKGPELPMTLTGQKKGRGRPK